MLKVAKFLYTFIMRSRLYFIWSKLYRFLFHKKYREVQLDIDLSPAAALKKMNKLTWTKDSVKEMGDALGSPQWVQHCINEVLSGRAQPRGALDCDEFAVWSATCIDHTLFPGCLNVFWRGKKFTGHNVCVYRMNMSLYYIGNWGVFGPFTMLKDIILDIIHKGAGPAGELVGWTLFSKKLKVHLVDTELP